MGAVMPTISAKIAVYLVCAGIVAAALAGLVVYHKTSVSAAYDTGYTKGATDASEAIAKVQVAERDFRDAEKLKLETEAKGIQDEAAKDVAAALARFNGVQLQLAKVRNLIRQYSTTDTSGSSAGETANLLTDLLERHISVNRELGAFADQAYNAGRTCEQQYDSLRREHGKD